MVKLKFFTMAQFNIMFGHVLRVRLDRGSSLFPIFYHLNINYNYSMVYQEAVSLI
jgi:hypothetical protein